MTESNAFRRAVLANGLRVVTTRRAGTPLAAIKLFFKVGSRHDNGHPGIAHFLEHLLFSSALVSPNRTAYQAIEALGGEVNAVTTREYTALQAVVSAPYVDSAVAVFADLLTPRPLDPAIVERERRIILEEIDLHSDSPQIIWDLFQQALWDGDPLAQPIMGTRESVAAVTLAELTAGWSRYQAANQIVLAAAGHVDHDALVHAVQARFDMLQPRPLLEEGHRAGIPKRRLFLEKDTHQTHLAIGVEAPAMGDPRRYAVRLLDIVLGRGATSRLHQALRTERGLVYHVSSVAMSYADRGYFAAYTTCAPEHTPTVTAVILDELDRMRTKGVSEEELAAAKTNYEGSLARYFETVLSLASITGIEELLARVEPFEESVARIRQVTVDEVHRAAAEVLALDDYAISIVGRRGEDA